MTVTVIIELKADLLHVLRLAGSFASRTATRSNRATYAGGHSLGWRHWILCCKDGTVEAIVQVEAEDASSSSEDAMLYGLEYGCLSSEVKVGGGELKSQR